MAPGVLDQRHPLARLQRAPRDRDLVLQHVVRLQVRLRRRLDGVQRRESMGAGQTGVEVERSLDQVQRFVRGGP
jgi:hypothetical protein